MNYTIKQGNNIDILKQYADNHFDSIVTDPPYGIEFLGKDWDSNTGAIETWKECYRVLKPGGHLLAFSAARTYHHLATNIENCGFEIRDQLMWIYASGFPKAQDIGKAIQRRQGVTEYEYRDKTDGYNLKNEKGFTENNDVGYGKMKGIAVPTSPEAQQWSGWKTALKPGHEPIVMARKPFKGSTIDNVLAHGTGALNIDATRIGDETFPTENNVRTKKGDSVYQGGWQKEQDNLPAKFHSDAKGRFPSNVLGEITDYQKYFYCPKVSRAERHCGFEQNNIPTDPSGMWDIDGTGVQYNANKGSLDHIATDSDGMLDKGVLYQHTKGGSLDHIITKDATNGGNHYSTSTHPTDPNLPNYTQDGTLGRMKDKMHKLQVGNNHPTVKPVALMKYLIQLVTPEGGSVLDPFCGSGSTGMAAVEADMCFTGCELDPNYVAIANKRIEAWYTRTQPDNNFNQLFD